MEPNHSTDEVYSVLCSHETDDGGVKFVLANCGEQKGVQHRIRQWGDGYICSRCSELISSACSAKVSEDVVACYQCQGPEELERYITSRQICSHDVPDSKKTSKVRLECMESEKPLTHELDLGGKKICQECERKLIYKYQGQEECKICRNKVAELLSNLSNSLANEQTRMIKKLMMILAEKNCPEEFKEELEVHCNRKKTKASEEKAHRHQASCRLKDQKGFLENFSQLNHKEGKYYFFTKCQVHKSVSLKACPTCIAVLLNLNRCPYGCESKNLQENVKQAKGKQVYETGFIVFAPIPKTSSKQKNHCLQMILLRNIVIKNKLDQTEGEIREVVSAAGNQITEKDYPQFGAVVQLDNKSYLLSGGLLASEKQPTITGGTWLFEITQSGSEMTFKATKKAAMITPRTAHSLVLFHEEVYAVGGFSQKGYLKDCEKFNLKENKWVSIPSLKYGRSKPTVFVTSGSSPQIVVLGGISPDMEVFVYGEKFTKDAKQWVTIKDGNPNYTDDSSLTRITSSSQNPQLAKYDNTLLFGGSNYKDYCNTISNFKIKDDTFFIDPLESPNLLSKKAGAFVGLLETADKNQKKLVLFSGCLDHESAIDFQIVLLQIKDGKTITPVYTEKAYESSDFSKLLNVDRHKFYGQLAGLLQDRGVNINQKLKNEKDTDRKKQHTTETLWFWGRPISNYAVEKQK